MGRQANPPIAPHCRTLIFTCTGYLAALRGHLSHNSALFGRCQSSGADYSFHFFLQDAVWEKLDTIDGNTVYVGSRINQPGTAPQ